MPLRQRRLANGLQQISLPHQGSSNVSVQLWYRVGSRDDPPGRSGFAPQFEHMMFKGTRHMADEMFDRLTEDVGGQNNAYTAEDMTVYQSEVPSNHLERLLWAEAERMAHLRVDQATFDSERRVVISELRDRVLADPYGRFFNALTQYGFRDPRYQRPVIGNEAELNAATLADVQRFHARHYRPDNALLIVAGEFDALQLDGWVDRYFGPLASPSLPPPPPLLLPPSGVGGALPAHRRITVTAPQVPLPALALLWPGPAAAADDAPAPEVAAALLALGDASRLNEALVYREQLAQTVGFSAELYADAGLLTAYAIAAGPPDGASVTEQLDRLEQALLRQLRRLADGPIPAAELARVRRQLLTAALLARQTPQGLAQAVGQATLLLGGADEADRRLARLQAVTGTDVQRAMRRHLAAARRVTLHYVQQVAR